MTQGDWEQRCQKRAATCDAYRVAKQQRMAARRALEWIGTSKPRLVLDMKYQTFFLKSTSTPWCIFMNSLCKECTYSRVRSVYVLVLPLSRDPTPREESWSQIGEPVPPINFVQYIICTHHNTLCEVLTTSVKAFGSLVMYRSINTFLSCFCM